MAVANLDDPSALAHLIAGALRIKPEEKQALLEEVDVAKRLRRLSEILARELDIVAIGSKIQSQVMSEMESSQREYVLRQQLKAIQEELGEKDPAEAEVDELREQLAQLAAARGGAQAGRPRALAAGEAAAGRGRARRDPHLPGVDRRAAVGHAHRRQPRPRGTPARCSTRTTTTSRRSRTGSSSSWPCASCAAGAARGDLIRGGDHLLRRAARRGQDVAGPLDRPRHGAQVRAHQRRRRARRGGDPRPPPHLHRRHAGHDHPRAARRGLPEPAVHDRRDRQDGRGLPRRPGQRDARGARPRAEHARSATTTSTCRSTSRRSCSSPRRTRWTRSRRRCATAWRSSSSPATPSRRSCRSPAATSCRARSSGPGSSARRSRSPTPGCGRSSTAYTREAGVRNLEREIGSACRKVARRVAEGTLEKKVSVSAPRVRELLGRARFHGRPQAAHVRAGRGHGAGLDAGGRRRAVRRGHGDARDGQADHHGSARRRHEGVRPGRAVLRARPRRPPRGLVRHPRPAHPRARGGDPQGRPERRHHDGHGADVAGQRAPRARRRGHDGRAHADRPGAADRRPEGEGARGAACRGTRDPGAAPQRAGSGGHPRAAARRHGLRVGG